MNLLVSICIPTYQRPELLRRAIESCLMQTYQPVEIIICDDSKDDASEKVINSLQRPDVIRYHRNHPSLGQAKNVNRLFDLAEGDRLVLLHDDDLLLPTAIQEMDNCWQRHPNLTACFGKQYMISMQGEVLEEPSQQLNEKYHRTEQKSGLQQSTLFSAMTGQFPNDGYMVLTKAAQHVRYRDRSEVSDACDFDFGLRLASSYEHFYFVNQYTAMYRLTETAVSSQISHSHITYGLIESLTVPPELAEIRGDRLRTYASPAINEWLSLGNQSAAHKIYTSPHHSWSKRLTLRGSIQFLLIICPRNLSTQVIKRLKNR